jgi:hypothetical protein
MRISIHERYILIYLFVSHHFTPQKPFQPSPHLTPHEKLRIAHRFSIFVFYLTPNSIRSHTELCTQKHKYDNDVLINAVAFAGCCMSLSRVRVLAFSATRENFLFSAFKFLFFAFFVFLFTFH